MTMKRVEPFSILLYIENQIYLEDGMKSLLTFAGIMAAWYILNRWVLPRLGVQT